jgi:DNA polymerase I
VAAAEAADRREQCRRVYERVDRPLVPVIGRMERRGVKVDRDYLARLSREFAEEIAARGADLRGRLRAVHDRLAAAARRGAVRAAGPQGRAQGQERHNIRPTSTSSSGSPAEGVECARLVLDWRQLTKLKSTYTDALQAQINPETGRVHTSFSLTGAQTGRLASNDPNLQNIPIRTEIGRKIRDAFVAEPGNVLMSADYSQIELRLAAHMADVPQLKEAFRDKADIHNMTAQELFGDRRPRHRNKAKTSISRSSTASRAGASPAGSESRGTRARRSSTAISSASPASALYRRDAAIRPRARLHPHLVRPQDPLSQHPRVQPLVPRQGAERAAVNAPIQGTSADLIKRAMARMDERWRAGLNAPDAAPGPRRTGVRSARRTSRRGRGAEIIRRVMEGAAGPALEARRAARRRVGWGANWGAAH